MGAGVSRWVKRQQNTTEENGTAFNVTAAVLSPQTCGCNYDPNGHSKVLDSANGNRGDDLTSLTVSLCVLGFGFILLFRFAYYEYFAFLTMKRVMIKNHRGESDSRHKISLEEFIKYRFLNFLPFQNFVLTSWAEQIFISRQTRLPNQWCFLALLL